LTTALARFSEEVLPKYQLLGLTHRFAVEGPMQLLTRGTTPQRGGTPTNEVQLS